MGNLTWGCSKISNVMSSGQIVGESLRLSTVASRAKLAWRAILAEVEEVDMRNGWIRFKFSTIEDKNFV